MIHYVITARTAGGVITYSAIGDLGDLLSAAYDCGAMGVTAIVKPAP